MKYLDYLKLVDHIFGIGFKQRIETFFNPPSIQVDLIFATICLAIISLQYYFFCYLLLKSILNQPNVQRE